MGGFLYSGIPNGSTQVPPPTEIASTLRRTGPASSVRTFPARAARGHAGRSALGRFYEEAVDQELADRRGKVLGGLGGWSGLEWVGGWVFLIGWVGGWVGGVWLKGSPKETKALLRVAPI